MLIAIGLALYPMGWDNIEVLQACGGVSKPYQLGKPHLFLD
jgi:Lipoma HMGIC fusion partner-like protein